MKIVNIHDAKTHLSRLIEQAERGEPFIIARAGKPVVKVSAVDAPEKPALQRLGFLAGQIEIPDDFNEMGRDEIERMFEGSK